MSAKKPKVELLCAYCGNAFHVQPYRASKAKYCCWLCGQRGKSESTATIRGEKLRGRGERRGYVKLGGRHMHRVIAERKIGRSLLPGEIVHHLDENKQNNSPENLEVIYQPDHVRIHFKSMMRKRKEVSGY